MGLGLARRLPADAVIIGSRRPAEGDAAAVTYLDAVRDAEIVVLCLPASSYEDLLPPLADAAAGKNVISTAVPFPFAGISAALRARDLLPRSLVAGALHTVSAQTLEDDAPLDEDTFITSDTEEGFQGAEHLVGLLPGLRPVRAGTLKAALYCEAATHLLLGVNRALKIHSGLRVTGVPAS